jgi:hypothetical protein
MRAEHIIVAVSQAIISLVQASNLFSYVHHESDIGSHAQYHLMKGQSQVAHDEMKLRGSTVEKKATEQVRRSKKVLILSILSEYQPSFAQSIRFSVCGHLVLIYGWDSTAMGMTI